MKKTLITLLLCIPLLSLAGIVHAQNPSLSVTPVVIDEKAQARDILKESITIKNLTTHVLEVYPSVNDINAQLGEQGYVRATGSDGLSNSLANWIEISRGMVQLAPGEEKAIPFLVRVNMNAVAAAYHAQISLTEGGTRAEADAKPPLGVVMVNVEIKADIKELLQLNTFSTGNIYFSGDDVLFSYKLQNIGNQQLQPKGEVHIYNRQGIEVANVPVNHEGKTISPDQAAQLASVWSAANGFGRYKAMLTVDYGSAQTATVQDTVFFWVVPWKQMLAVFVVSLAIIVVLALQFHSWLERRHLYKFADAGLLNDEAIKKIHGDEPSIVASVAPVPKVKQNESFQPVQKEKKRFGMFRRSAKVTEESFAPILPEQPKPEHKSLKDVLRKDVVPQQNGSSIDLKQLRQQISEPTFRVGQQVQSSTKAEISGNVISLKKPQ